MTICFQLLLQGGFRTAHASNRAPSRAKSRRLLSAASVGALAVAAPVLIPSVSYAQALPAGCTSSVGAPGTADPGDTVTCLSPPNPIDPISTTADNLTINIGDATTPTSVSSNNSNAIQMIGAGSQILNIRNPNSAVIRDPNSYGPGIFDFQIPVFTGSGGAGVLVEVTGGVGDLSIASEGVIGGAGVFATHNGTGDLIIDIGDLDLPEAPPVPGGEDTLYGAGAPALSAIHNGAGDIWVSAGTIFDAGGLEVIHNGDGDINVDSVSLVDAQPDAGFGTRVRIDNALSTGDISITSSETVVGGFVGMNVVNQGSGDTSIVVSGEIDGRDDVALLTQTRTGATIVLNDGADVAGFEGGIQVVSGVGAVNTISVNEGSFVSSIQLDGEGEDIVNANGGDIGFINSLASRGSNTINFGGAGYTILQITNDQRGLDVRRPDGSRIDGVRTENVQTINFVSGAHTLIGIMEADQISIGEDATLIAGDGSPIEIRQNFSQPTLPLRTNTTIVGDPVNNGALDIAGDAIGVLAIEGDYTQTATGVLAVDVGDNGSDLLTVDGDVRLAGELAINNMLSDAPNAPDITLIDATGSVIGDFDTITGGVIFQEALVIDRANGDVLLSFRLATLDNLANLNANQRSIGENILDLLADPTLDPNLAALSRAVGAIESEAALQSTLDNLMPESLDFGLRAFGFSQNHFLNTVLNQSQGRTAPSGAVRTASLGGGPVAASDPSGVKFWLTGQGFGLDQDGGASNADFDGENYAVFGGLSGLSLGPVSLGIAGGYSEFSGEGGGALGDDADADAYHIALSLNGAFADIFGTGISGSLDSVLSYATGETRVGMRLIDPVSAQTIFQNGEADTDSIDWLSRFTVEKVGERAWPVKPFIEGGVRVYSQDTLRIGTSEASALLVDDLDQTTGVIAIGATYAHKFSDAISFRANLAGRQYLGDTQNVFSSRFAAAPTSLAFETRGNDVERQVELDAAIAYRRASGFVIEGGVFGQTGDIDVYGARIGLSTPF